MAVNIVIATHDLASPRAAITITSADLLRSVYVVGKTGSGKSALMECLLLGAVDAGFGCALLDPHGDLAQRVLALLPRRHWNRLVLFEPADDTRPVGLNLLAPTIGASRAIVASGLVEVFRKLWGPTLFGPRSEHLLRHALLALLETPDTTLLGLLRLLVDEAYRYRIITRVTDPVVRLFWTREVPLIPKHFWAEIVAPLLNKLGALTAPAVRRVVGQASPRLRLREIMDGGRILVCDLSRIGADATELLGALVVTGLTVAAQSRAELPPAQRRPFLVFADEFHRYATSSFVGLLAESRKFGVGAVLAHQHAAQLPDDVRAAILGNAGTLVAFTQSADDAKLLAPEFAPEVTATELARLPRYRIALRLLRNGTPTRPTTAYTIPPPAAGPVPPTLLRIARERYGRLATTVDAEIAEAIGSMRVNEKSRRLA